MKHSGLNLLLIGLGFAFACFFARTGEVLTESKTSFDAEKDGNGNVLAYTVVKTNTTADSLCNIVFVEANEHRKAIRSAGKFLPGTKVMVVKTNYPDGSIEIALPFSAKD